MLADELLRGLERAFLSANFDLHRRPVDIGQLQLSRLTRTKAMQENRQATKGGDCAKMHRLETAHSHILSR